MYMSQKLTELTIFKIKKKSDYILINKQIY